MSIEISSRGVGVSISDAAGKEFIKIDIYGKLRQRDYRVLKPVLEHIAKSVRSKELDLLIDMRDFKGWSAKAAIDEIELSMKLRNSFDKAAIVGDRLWEDLAVRFASHFCSGKIKFFKSEKKALRWLLSDKKS